MSKAEELAKWLGRGNISHLNAAAHLRALDASHQRLKEALEAIKAKAGDPEAVYLIARAALEQAKDLS